MKTLYRCLNPIFVFTFIFLTYPLDVSSNDVRTLRLTYPTTKEEIIKRQHELSRRYHSAVRDETKKLIIKDAQKFLFDILTETTLPSWLGTPWSFNGTTRTPGEGSIACGTFVVYILQDVGFKIPSSMARQPSENIIKNLIGTKEIKRFVNAASMEQVKNWIVKSGEGIYVFGLDIHVGFIINKNNNITFFHSNYYNPPLKVVNQDLMETSPLTDSQYRVLGKILDDKMTEKWIKGEAFPEKYDYFSKGTDEIKEGKYAYPHKFWYLQWNSSEDPKMSEGYVTDYLFITKADENKVDFSFDITADNGHTCHMSGSALRKGSHYEYTEELDEDVGDTCILEIKYNGNEIVLGDKTFQCRHAYCGIKGNIDGIKFSLDK